MNKKGFLLATSAGFAFAPTAHAADMSLKAPAALPPPPMWTGFYIGGNIGTYWGQAQNALNAGNSNKPLFYGDYANNILPFSSTATTSKSGFIGGGQIGYNWQYGSYVWGVEGDFQGLSGSGTTALNGTGTTVPFAQGKAFPFPTTTSFENRIRWLSTLRTRSGLAFGDTMAYVTGGLAIGGVRNSFTYNNIGFGPDYSGTFSQSKTRVGWTVGFGVEHMWDQHWTIAAEGLFVDLGNSTYTGTIGHNIAPNKTTPFTYKASNQAVIGRLKLNYKF